MISEIARLNPSMSESPILSRNNCFSTSTKKDPAADLLDIHADFINRKLTVFLNDHIERIVEKASSVFLQFLKDSKDELKGVMIGCLTKILTPQFITKPSPDIPKKYKAIILSAVSGAESFFNDFDQALASKFGCFETIEMTKLQGEGHHVDAFEDEIIDKMNICLRQKNLHPILPLPHDEQELENNLRHVTTNLLRSIFPSKTSLESEALIVLAGLYLSKAADLIFSSFTMLHLLDKLLNHSIGLDAQITEPPLSFQDSPIDMEFANGLDEQFHKLILHLTKLGANGIANRFFLVILMRIVLQVIQGSIGLSCAKSIQATAHSPSSATILAWAVDLFYREDVGGNTKTPFLLSFDLKPDLQMRQYKYHIETAIREHRLFGKINSVIKNLLKDGDKGSVSKKHLLHVACKNVVVDSSIIKGLCDNFTRKLYILFQRKRLLKMLYCYMAESIRKASVV